MSHVPLEAAPFHDLPERASTVLCAAVSEFIATGEPVGSRTLSTRYGLALSPASIRNVLKDLEDEGYLTQPHTSAGRIPTEKAFRLYIDALMQVRRLPEEHAERIREHFRKSPGGREWGLSVGTLLSELSGAPAVVLRSRTEARVVEKIRFIPTRPGELLVVLVLDDGSVENRFIPLESPVPAASLERLHLLLDELCTGKTLSALREQLRKEPSPAEGEVGALSRLSGQLLRPALSGVERSQELIVTGRPALLSQHEEPSQLRGFLLALEDREQLARLLDRTLDSARVQVFLGSESEATLGSPLSLVAAPFQNDVSAPVGALGVLGRNRMDYARLVPLVGAMAQAMSRSLVASPRAFDEPGGPPGGQVDPSDGDD